MHSTLSSLYWLLESFCFPAFVLLCRKSNRIRLVVNLPWWMFLYLSILYHILRIYLIPRLDSDQRWFCTQISSLRQSERASTQQPELRVESYPKLENNMCTFCITLYHFMSLCITCRLLCGTMYCLAWFGMILHHYPFRHAVIWVLSKLPLANIMVESCTSQTMKVLVQQSESSPQIFASAMSWQFGMSFW